MYVLTFMHDSMGRPSAWEEMFVIKSQGQDKHYPRFRREIMKLSSDYFEMIYEACAILMSQSIDAT